MTQTNRITRLVATAVPVLLGMIALVATAQRAPDTARGGATLLTTLNAPVPAVAAPATATTAPGMTCARCVDVASVQADLSSKGGARGLLSGGVPQKTVITHGCGQCATTITVGGEGRAKHDVRRHGCVGCI